MMAVRSLLSVSCRSAIRPTKLVHCRLMSSSGLLIDRLRTTARALAPEHPFKRSVTHQNARSVMGKYLGMSQAFPYLQAGAYVGLIRNAMKKNCSISPDVEKTFVAGSFLCWDETGGHHLVSAQGNGALPKALDTEQHFHSRLLERDLVEIFGQPVPPNYCPSTRAYLIKLSDKLGSPNKVTRVAMMVSFEMHAETMLLALWDSISKITMIPKDELTYFQTHVGGDDPAEAYHVALTQRLVKELVSSSEEGRFEKQFAKLYQLNLNWCQAIVK